MRSIKRAVACTAVTLALAGGLAAPAMAASWTHTSMTGIVTVNGTLIKLKDNKDDGRFVSTEFKYNNGQSYAGLSNKMGYGQITSTTVTSNITNDKVCVSNQAPLPMDCGSWKF